jgi:dihydroorotate dehydrogenase electron transfer subunit
MLISIERTGRVVSNREVIPGTYIMWLKISPAFAVLPGQFFMVKCGENLLRRPFSIYSSEDDKYAIVYRVVGQGTAWLSKRKEGEEINILGPLGNSFEIPEGECNMLLIAGGLGIASISFLAEKISTSVHRVKLLYGAHDKDCLLPPSFLPDGLDIEFVTDDGSFGQKSLVTGLVPPYLGWAEQIFACGPLAMLRGLKKVTAASTIPIQVSLEARMGCGLGVCYGCAIKTKDGMKLVCHDGPVFQLENVDLESMAI